jgi:hypothetical protein
MVIKGEASLMRPNFGAVVLSEVLNVERVASCVQGKVGQTMPNKVLLKSCALF